MHGVLVSGGDIHILGTAVESKVIDQKWGFQGTTKHTKWVQFKWTVGW